MTDESRISDRYDGSRYAHMNTQELDAQLSRYRGASPTWGTEDRIEALRDAAVASAARIHDTSALHPLAAVHMERGPMGPRRLAEEIASAVGRPLTYASANEVVALATSTAHYPSAIIDSARAAMRARRSPLLSDVLALTADLRVSNYNAEGFGVVDIDLDMPTDAGGRRFMAIRPEMTGQAIQAFSTFAKITVTEQALAADDHNFLPAAVAAFGSAAARAEHRAIAELLEANVLPDGSDLFSAGNDNVATGALTAAGLGVGFAALRGQQSETGAATGNPCSALVVHADDEAAALALVEALPAERQPRVIASPFLSNNTYWYFAAAPQTAPTIARVLMIGADESGVSFSGVGPANWMDEEGVEHHIPGIAIDASHTSAVQAVSPVGIVRVAKS